MKKMLIKPMIIITVLFGFLLTACMDGTIKAELEARGAGGDLIDDNAVLTEIETNETTELSKINTANDIMTALEPDYTEENEVISDILVKCETFDTYPDNPDTVPPVAPAIPAAATQGAVTAEEIVYNRDENSLYIRFKNDTGYDLEHVYNLSLSSNCNILAVKEGFGVCGTPDSFPAGSVFEMSYPLDNIYGSLSDGYYSFSVEFKLAGNQYDGVYNVIGGFRAGEANGEISYNVNYLGNGDIEIRYKNSTDYTVTYGLSYELTDSGGNKVNFLENAAVIAIAYVIYPDGENLLPLNIGHLFGELPRGEYTVLHELWSDAGSVMMEIPIRV